MERRATGLDETVAQQELQGISDDQRVSSQRMAATRLVGRPRRGEGSGAFLLDPRALPVQQQR